MENERQMKEKYQGKRILITGGLGMIGSSIANKLVPYGAKVVVLDARLEPYGFNEFNIKDIKDKVEVIHGDIRHREKLLKIVNDFDIIFNLAGQVSHNDSMKHPLLDAEINYTGHLNVLEAVREVNPKIKIIYSGSRLEYGKILRNPVREDHPLTPLTPYALNKSTAEQIYLFYHRMFNIPVVLFRISNPYGPRGQIKHNKYCMINWFIRTAMDGGVISVFGEGTQKRDYIYIDDLVEAMVAAAVDTKTDGKVFNLGAGYGVEFKEMAEMVVKLVGKGKVTYIPWPDDYINVETGDFVADITFLKNTIDWQPVVDLKTGIKETFNYYAKYKSNYV
jgi:nucleoside-diphosphate-sugar epimerase